MEEHTGAIRQIHDARNTLLRGDAEAARAALMDLAQLEPSLEGYSTWQVVLGECLYSLGRHSEACDAFRRAVQLSPNSPRAEILLELSTAVLQLESPDSAPVALRTGPGVTPVPTFSLLFGELEDEETEPRTLGELAAELLSSSRIASRSSRESSPDHAPATEASRTTAEPLSEAPEDTPQEQPGLVSETLAKIMVKQGKLEDAKKVYIQLARLNPERYEYFKARIAELAAAPEG